MPIPTIVKGPFLVCRKSGIIVGVKRKSRLLCWLFPIVGLFALLWYLIRVVPKPSRAAYPCQRAAAQLAGGFVVWLLGVIGSSIAWRTGKEMVRRSRWGMALLVFSVSIVGAVGVIVNVPNPRVGAAGAPASHGPLGVAKGIHPGRVVWIRVPNAVNWDGYNSPEHWWEPNHTDLASVEVMMASAIRGVAGASTDLAAWDAVFRHFNQNNGRDSRGYQPGEKIAIKINLTACNARWEAVDPNTYEKKDPNTIDNSPQMILALLRQLVHKAGVNPADISVGDPTGLFPNYMWNILHPEFPDVHYFDNLGGAGRTRTEFSTVPIGWSTSAADGKRQDYLPTQFAEADYIINFAILKGHTPGVTLTAKNHYGSLLRGPDGFLRDYGLLDYYDLHLSLPNAGWIPGMGHYRALVDLMGHRQLGGKTLLYFIDGLFGGLWGGSATPYKWGSAPFGDGTNANWPASLFASQDPVAIDSVAYDFLLNEWPNVVTGGNGAPGSLQGGAEDYLHEAAQADNPPSGTFYDPEKVGIHLSSLGVHEHWNNPTDKQYSRNLGGNNGIELVRVMIGLVRVMITPNQTYTVTGPNLLCAGSANNTYTATAPEGATHSWRISGNGAIVGPIDGSSVTVAAGTSGSFTITDTVMLNGYDGIGSMTVTVDSNAQCSAQTSVTINTVPAGLGLSVDGNACTSPQTFQWAPGSSHTIAAASPQAGTAGTRYVFANWSDGGTQSHTTITLATATNYTANFTTQYQLSTALTPTDAGIVSPISGGWYPSETVAPVKAFPNNGYSFVSWSGPVANTGAATTSVTMTGPASITAMVTPVRKLKTGPSRVLAKSSGRARAITEPGRTTRGKTTSAGRLPAAVGAIKRNSAGTGAHEGRDRPDRPLGPGYPSNGSGIARSSKNGS